jgi:hypothetical protein
MMIVTRWDVIRRTGRKKRNSTITKEPARAEGRFFLKVNVPQCARVIFIGSTAVSITIGPN